MGASRSLPSARSMLSSADGARPSKHSSSPSRPGTGSGKILKAWRVDPNSGTSKAAGMVGAWWSPVEQSVRTKQPRQLEAALKTAHGAQYLKTLRVLRRSASLKAAERHALEVEMAARLVSARALHGKWQAGLQELRAARSTQDLDALSAALERWDLAEEDEEIAAAKHELGRWRGLAAALPAVLRESLQNRDIAQLREALDELRSGPTTVDGSEAARRLLDKFDTQVRALDQAARSGLSRDIQVAIAAWEFESTNEHVVRARQALSAREYQKRCLQSATAAKDTAQLRAAVDAWNFEASDEDFAAARALLERYGATCAELQRIAQPPMDFVLLDRALLAWDFSPAEPVAARARACLEGYQASLRAALQQRDGWALQRGWLLGASGAALASEQALRREAAAMLQDYAAACERLKQSMIAAAHLHHGGGRTTRLRLAEELSSWSFADNDPLVTASTAFLRLQSTLHEDRVANLRGALEANDWTLIQQGVRRLWAASEEEVPELSEARGLGQGLQAAASIALGVGVAELKGSAERSRLLDEAAERVRRAARAVDARALLDLKAVSKPPRSLHAMLELLMHILSGIEPSIRDPPRDTDWRSCQRMVTNPAALLDAMQGVPGWAAAGHCSGIVRAIKKAKAVRTELGDLWAEEPQVTSRVPSLLAPYLEAVFMYHVELTGGDAAGASLFAYAQDAANPPRQSQRTHSPQRARGMTQGQIKQPCSVPLIRRGTEPVLDHGAAKDGDLSPAPLSPLLEPAEDVQRSPLSDPRLRALAASKECLCSCATVAASWVVLGGDTKELLACVERVRRRAHLARAAATVAGSKLAALVAPRPPEVVAPEPRRRNAVVGAVCKHLYKGAIKSDVPRQPSALAVPVSLISGAIVATVELPEGATVRELKAAVERLEGSSARSHRSGDLAALATRGITMIRRCTSVTQRLEMAVAAIGPALSAAEGPSRRLALEPVRHLLFGTVGDGAGTGGRRALEQALSETVQACLAVLHAHSASPGHVPAAVRSCAAGGPLACALDFVVLNERAVKGLRLPMLNLASARRAVAVGSEHCPVALAEVLAAVAAFFEEYVTQHVLAVTTASAAEEAEAACAAAERTTTFATTLTPMVAVPLCIDAEAVGDVARTAMAQLRVLAGSGIVMAAMHVEFVRQAIDAAALGNLQAPPAGEAGDRIRWAEEVVALQLTAVPHCQEAVSYVASLVPPESLVELLAQPSPSSPEVARLLAAILWIVRPDCRCDTSWASARDLVLADPDGFLGSLSNPQLLAEVAPRSVERAGVLLQEISFWIVAGCGSSAALALCAWAAAVVAMLPLAVMSQRLQPVHRELRKSLARIRKAPEKQAQGIAAKAWTSVLFLLDAKGEPWWWLGLIRPASSMEPPWTDHADGGVAPSPHVVLPNQLEVPSLCSTPSASPERNQVRTPRSAALADSLAVTPIAEGWAEGSSMMALDSFTS